MTMIIKETVQLDTNIKLQAITLTLLVWCAILHSDHADGKLAIQHLVSL